jgi:hypothetical protein
MIIKYKFIDRNGYVKRVPNLYTLFHTGRSCIKNLADDVLQEIIFSEFIPFDGEGFIGNLSTTM